MTEFPDIVDEADAVQNTEPTFLITTGQTAPYAVAVPIITDTRSAAHVGALQMASLGIPVFPLHGITLQGHCGCRLANQCKHPGKHPHHLGSMNDATTDVDQIDRWFQQVPTLNYGVQLGRELHDSGKMLMVIDVDGYKPGGTDALDALEAMYGRLPDTAEVISGAKGRHCYYWVDKSFSFKGTMGKNIDLKVNGYIVGPGSLHASGKHYEWEGSSDLFEGHPIADLPHWVIDNFGKSAKHAEQQGEVTHSIAPMPAYEKAVVKHDLGMISASCGRTEWLKVLMALHSRSQSLDMYRIADEWSQTSPDKYDGAAVRKAWNSFKPGGGITYAHVDALVGAATAESADLTKLMASLERGANFEAAEIDGNLPLPLAQAEVQRYQLRSASELASAPPLQWMVRGVFPQNGIAALYGASGTGKSFLALDLAVTVAGGAEEWYGMRVKNCPVTYCVLEGEGGMGKRVQAWQQHHGKALPDALRFVTQPINLQQPTDLRDLAAAVIGAGGGGGLLIVDTLNRAAPEADENSSKDMGAIIAASKALQGAVGGLVMLVHHTGKDAGQGMRGHSSLFAAMDSVISVTKAYWEVKKSKDDATGAQYSFKLEPLALGEDDEGDEVTSCVAVPVAAAFALRQSKKLGPHQEVALETIKGMVSEFISTVHYPKAVDAVADKLGVDKKHKRERAKDAIASLNDLGKLQIENNYIRPVQ